MKAREVAVCLPNSPSPLTKTVLSVSNAHAMELHPTDNVQNFPIATLDTSVDKSPFGSKFQSQVKGELPRVFTGHFVRPSKLSPHFEKGSLIDIYA
jgi:hypothetical protein